MQLKLIFRKNTINIIIDECGDKKIRSKTDVYDCIYSYENIKMEIVENKVKNNLFFIDKLDIYDFLFGKIKDGIITENVYPHFSNYNDFFSPLIDNCNDNDIYFLVEKMINIITSRYEYYRNVHKSIHDTRYLYICYLIYDCLIRRYNRKMSLYFLSNLFYDPNINTGIRLIDSAYMHYHKSITFNVGSINKYFTKNDLLRCYILTNDMVSLKNLLRKRSYRKYK